MATTGNNVKFSLDTILDLFRKCQADSPHISLTEYVNAYEEICKMLNLFGMVFSFVVSDVQDKMRILRDYLKSEDKESYETVQGMIEFEVNRNLTVNKSRPSGSRTLLRLHRALDFILRFMRGVKEEANETKMSGVGAKAYEQSLAKFHPWLIRKGVQVALLTLPTRKKLLEQMEIRDEESAARTLGEIIDEGYKVYQVIEDLYTKHELHALP